MASRERKRKRPSRGAAKCANANLTAISSGKDVEKHKGCSTTYSARVDGVFKTTIAGIDLSAFQAELPDVQPRPVRAATRSQSRFALCAACGKNIAIAGRSHHNAFECLKS